MKLSEHYSTGDGTNVAPNVDEVCVSVQDDGLTVEVEYWDARNGRKTTRYINHGGQNVNQITITDD